MNKPGCIHSKQYLINRWVILPKSVFGFGNASCITGDARMAEIIGESRSNPLSSGIAERLLKSNSH